VRYLGGKSRIAKHIAPIVNAARTAERPYFWDPFCGGLSMAVALAKHGPGVVSDKNPALIALYQAVRNGWEPPSALSEAEWRAARELPDSDPLKAFAGVCCSFSGMWFGSYTARGGRNPTTGAEKHAADSGQRALRRDIPKLAQCQIITADFLETEPRPWPIVIYADPPYAGTAGYAATGPFDHGRFWRRCAEWERLGVPVFVSEYACPVSHTEIWSRQHRRFIGGADKGAQRIDRLFRVLP